MKNSILPFCLIIALFYFSCTNPEKTPKGTEDKKAVSETMMLDSLDKLILKDSLDPGLYLTRSRYYLEQSNPNMALADINKAIQLNGQDADYYITLADIYLVINKVPGCLDALMKALDLDPGNNEALLKISEVYLILQDYKNVFHFTGMALEKDRINPKAYFLRGYAYMETGDTSLAVKSFQVAAEQKQDYYEAYVQLGILFSINRNPLAIGYLKTATRIDPDRTEAWYLLGLAYQEQENISEAVETYNHLLSIEPDYQDAIFNLGYVNLVYLEDYSAAISYFSRVIVMDPKNTDAYFNRGYSYELSGNFDEARKDYQKALEVTANYERAVEGLNRLDRSREP